MWIERDLGVYIKENESNLLLLGPRQTGKSSLIANVLSIPTEAWLQAPDENRPYRVYNLLRDEEFVRLSHSPKLLREEILAAAARFPVLTVILDEVQRIPPLLNEVQSLIDFHKKSRIRFILTGSSARKLKRGAGNLLPGRVVIKHFYPLNFNEWLPHFSLGLILSRGALPGILASPPENQWELLKAYVNTYLKEEIQSEGAARGIGPFSRFIEIAAAMSGRQINYSSISRDAGVPYSSIRNYFQILEDTLIGTLLFPFVGKTAKRLSLHPKLYLFDLGVRNALVNLNITEPPASELGLLFEHFIILELFKLAKAQAVEPRLFFWRTQAGAEVDCVIESRGRLIGLEIKAKTEISSADISGLTSFSETYSDKIERLMVLSLAERESVIGKIAHFPWLKGLKEIQVYLSQ